MVDRGARPGITAVVLAPAGADLRGLVEHLAEVGLDEVVVVDRSEGGGLVVESASVIHERSVSRGVALHRAAQTARGGLLVLLEPGDRLVEGRLSRAVASMAADPGVTAHVAVARLPDGSTRSAGARGLVLTREALCQVSRAAFFPVELELLSRLRGEGRLVEDDEVGVVPGSWDPGRIASDEQLLALGSHDGPPEISVIMATYDRRAVLLECLEALSRQSVPRGTHEVIVVEDGSPDDTAAWVADLELPIPFRYVRQDNAGASAARNRALRLARGRLTLWVNDDTIAFPDLIERHLAAHARLDDERAMVLGTFEQPPEALDNALMRYLEASTTVFSYPLFDPGQRIEGQHLYTCNASMATRAVVDQGGFDEDFPKCLGEDTDMGIRLEKAGYALYFHPECRAVHRHLLSFDDLKRRQLWTARAMVRLFERHPDVLLGWHPVPRLTEETAEAFLDEHAERGARLERAARELADLDVGALERAGGELRELSRDLTRRLAKLVGNVNGLWWRQGYLDGMRAHGISGFPELLGRELHTRRRREGPALTVVVPTHDRHPCLDNLLDALEAQDLDREEFEVIVVDDGSPRPASGAVRTDRPFALQVLRQDQAGPGAARNLAVSHARGDWVLFLNDDAVPAPDLLRLHLEAQTTPRPFPTAVLGRFDLLPHLEDTAFRRLVGRSTLLFAQPEMIRNRTYAGLSFCTGNLSVPRVVVQGIGGFDDAFRFAGAEDSEIGYRLDLGIGLRVLYDDRLRCGHDHALTPSGFARRQFVLGWCTWHMAAKHQDPTLIAGKGAKEPDLAFWHALREDLAASEAEVGRLADLIERSCLAEERGEAPLVPEATVEEAMNRIGFHAFSRGLQVAEAGFQPEDYRGGHPLGVGVAP